MIFCFEFFITCFSGTRKNLDITRLVPVELNSLLAMNAGLLSEWFAKIGDKKKSEEYREKSETLIRYIDEVNFVSFALTEHFI